LRPNNSGRRRARRGTADFDRQRGGRDPRAADGQGIEAAAGGDRQTQPGILLEDKGYSLALHYRLAPHAEKAIYEAVSLIRRTCRMRRSRCCRQMRLRDQTFRFQQGVRRHRIDDVCPFQGRRPIFIGDDVTTRACSDHADFGGLPFPSAGARRRGRSFRRTRDVREWLARLADDQAVR